MLLGIFDVLGIIPAGRLTFNVRSAPSLVRTSWISWLGLNCVVPAVAAVIIFIASARKLDKPVSEPFPVKLNVIGCVVCGMLLIVSLSVMSNESESSVRVAVCAFVRIVQSPVERVPQKTGIALCADAAPPIHRIHNKAIKPSFRIVWVSLTVFQY